MAPPWRRPRPPLRIPAGPRRDELGDLDPERLLAAGLPGENEGGIDPERLARAFPNLEIRELLGRGGMGVVYRARQKNLDREVAVKILPPGIGGDAAFAERFAREAKALAKLDHPNIVSVYEAGEADGLYFITMEYVDGVNLREAMRGGIEPGEALRIVPQICDALQYAHDRGIVHRDVKPENILLARGGMVKIADFGLAKLGGDRRGGMSLTGVGQVMGTVHYIAPEQIRTPKEVDHRADVYSLGVVFYEMLTGDLPIGRFPNPSEKVGVDVRIDAVVLRTLERERELRYQRAEDVKTGVEAAVSSPAAAATAPALDTAPRLSALAVAGVLGLPVGLLVGLLLLPLSYRDEHAVLVGAAVALIGFVLSMIAHLSIRRSGGRLTGDGLAKAGITLPLLAVLAFAVLVVVINLVEHYKAERSHVREQVEGWVRDLRGTGPVLTSGDLSPLLAPSIRAEIERDGLDRFRTRHGPELGLVFTDISARAGPWKVERVEIDGDRATVTIAGSDSTVTFPMVREDADWYFGPGPVEIAPR